MSDTYTTEQDKDQEFIDQEIRRVAVADLRGQLIAATQLLIESTGKTRYQVWQQIAEKRKAMGL